MATTSYDVFTQSASSSNLRAISLPDDIAAPTLTRVTAGRYAGDGNIIDGFDWAAYRERVEAGAREAQERAES